VLFVELVAYGLKEITGEKKLRQDYWIMSGIL